MAMGEAEGRQGARRRGRGGGKGQGPALPQLDRPPLPGPESLQLLLRVPAAGAEATPDGAVRAPAAAGGAGAAGLPEAQRAHAQRLAQLLESLASGDPGAAAGLGASERLVAAAEELVQAGALGAGPALLSDAPWPVVLSGEAVAAWAALPSALRRVVLHSLAELASGRRGAVPPPRLLRGRSPCPLHLPRRAFPLDAAPRASARGRAARSLAAPTQIASARPLARRPCDGAAIKVRRRRLDASALDLDGWPALDAQLEATRLYRRAPAPPLEAAPPCAAPLAVGPRRLVVAGLACC
jgi:hypothetical protein